MTEFKIENIDYGSQLLGRIQDEAKPTPQYYSGVEVITLDEQNEIKGTHYI